MRIHFWKILAIIGIFLIGGGLINCGTDPCHRYFQELKKRCRLGSSAEGAKLDRYLAREFRPCQLEICSRVSVDEIDCFNPRTHIPGGMDGNFENCK